MKFIEHRIADRRVWRHIKKWLNAGVLEDGEVRRQKEGTSQGGSISPLLANVYLHYVLDLWVHKWRRTQTHGELIVVRYADDFIVGFQYRKEAERFLVELKERLLEFGLQLHPEKTRLIEFGRFAAEDRQKRGLGKPETFDFLGFTHICAKSRKGKFQLRRRTIRKRLTAKLKKLKSELKKRMHLPVPVVGKWLGKVVTGHYRYYGVPLNYSALHTFRHRLVRLWCQTMRRRSQRDRTTWERIYRLADQWLPHPRIYHPYPSQRLRVITQGRSPVR